MKKILWSIGSIAAVAAIAFGATQAFFSDTETSTGNILQAGAIDLKVDNTCYYNGQACTRGFFGGQPNDPENPTNQCSCTWEPTDLSEEHLFFDLSDIKPGDWEEDTISLAVKNNEAWLCADVHLTSDDDVDCSEPEDEAEGSDINGPICENSVPAANADGDLADEIHFLWWADDGDNVLEDGERSLPAGPLGALDVSETAKVTLADSDDNIWGLEGPIPQGGDILFIGKAWCYGTIDEDPVAADRETPLDTTDDNNGPNTPTNADDPDEVTPEDGGFNCDGSGVGNESQTDKLTVDIGFRAEQARHNEDFLCNPTPTPTPTIPEG